MYLTNEVASILGISRTALLYYIEHDVVRPMTDEQTGYRYFSERDISTLKYCTILRNIGMPVKEIAEYLRGDDLKRRKERIRLLTEENRRRVMEQQAYLAAAQKLIEPYVPMEKPEITKCPEYIYCLTGCETGYHFLTTDPVSIQMLRSIPVAGFCKIFDESFYEEGREFRFKTGRAIKLEDAQVLGIPTYGLRFGGVRCVHWRVTGSGMQKNAQEIRMLNEYIEHHFLRIAGNPFCPDVAAYRPDRQVYMDIYIPIEEE